MKKVCAFIIVVLLCVIIYQYFNPHIETVTTTETVYDTDTIYKHIKEPYPVYTENIIIDTVKIPTDSIELKRKYLELYSLYYNKNHYKDTLKNDSSAFIYLEETVNKNLLFDRYLTFVNNRPTEINTTVINNMNSGFYIGAEIGLNSLQPNLMYQTKKGIQYSAGYDILQNSMRAGVNFRLSKK